MQKVFLQTSQQCFLNNLPVEEPIMTLPTVKTGIQSPIPDFTLLLTDEEDDRNLSHIDIQ